MPRKPIKLQKPEPKRRPAPPVVPDPPQKRRAKVRVTELSGGAIAVISKPTSPEFEAQKSLVKGRVDPQSTPGTRLMTRIRQVLKERSVQIDPVTKQRKLNTRFDDVADAFVTRMEMGEFQHLKEFIDREEGKVPQTITVGTPEQLKMYVDVPTDGPDAP